MLIGGVVEHPYGLGLARCWRRDKQYPARFAAVVAGRGGGEGDHDVSGVGEVLPGPELVEQLPETVQPLSPAAVPAFLDVRLETQLR